MRKQKILSVFGTRPEAIKMAPLIRQLDQTETFEHKVCSTGQHRDMLKGVLNFFRIDPAYSLEIMRPGQDLTDITVNVMSGLRYVFRDFRPDWVLVHGDTGTCFAASLAAFHAGIKIGHIEAGLRTHCLQSPFPEEANRIMTDRLAAAHFAPTPENARNLISEGICRDSITITGNTVVDALMWAKEQPLLFSDRFPETVRQLFDSSGKILLVTCHRRENQQDGLHNLCRALAEAAVAHSDLNIIFPVHPGPGIQALVRTMLSRYRNIHLLSPLDYPDFILTLHRCHAVITDSGGIQEEAAALKKPVLVLREVTERFELLHSGASHLIGTRYPVIAEHLSALAASPEFYGTEGQDEYPYGDGKASQRIVDALLHACQA